MSTRLADLYDADRHTAGRDDVARADVLIPHPLAWVQYADGMDTRVTSPAARAARKVRR